MTLDSMALAEQCELTAEALEDRAHRLIAAARELRSEAGSLALGERLAPEPEQRSVGRLGVVSEREAIDVAKTLGEFTRAQYGEALGLKGAAASRWLSKLLLREHPILVRDDRGGVVRYRYLPPPQLNGGRPKQAAPEVRAVTDAPQRGKAVRIVTDKERRRVSSKPKQGHLMRQRDKRYEQQRKK